MNTHLGNRPAVLIALGAVVLLLAGLAMAGETEPAGLAQTKQKGNVETALDGAGSDLLMIDGKHR